MKENLKLVESIEIKHIRKGKVIDTRSVELTPEQMKDLVVNVGKAAVGGDLLCRQTF